MSPAAAPVRRTRGGAGRRWPLWALGAALVVGGAAAGLTGVVEAPLRAQVDGANTAVNAGAGDLGDIDAHNSPALARNPVDPGELVVVNRVDSPDFSCGLHVSVDAGASFAETALPIPAGEEAKCYAPDATFDAAGTLYVSYVTLAGPGNVPDAVWLVSSDDAGRSVSTPTRVLGPLAFQTRLVADPTRPGRLHLTWVQAADVVVYAFPAAGYPIQASVTDDGGDSWSPPVRVNDPARQRVVAPAPAISADGRLHVAYLDLGEDRLTYHGGHEGRGGPPYPGSWQLVVARSTDGGRTWTETAVDALTPTERFLVFLPPFPSLAVDGARVYVAFHDGRAGEDADVWLWRSTDGGRTFGPPTRVNDNPAGDATRQYLPAVAVAPTGRVDVVYYDRRADPANVLNEVSLQSSVDQGRTFTPRVALSDRAFDSRVGFGSERDMPELGSWECHP